MKRKPFYAVHITIYDAQPYAVWRVANANTGRTLVYCPASRAAAEEIVAELNNDPAFPRL